MRLTMGFQQALDVRKLLTAVKKANKVALRESAKAVRNEARSLVSKKVKKTRGRRGARSGRSRPGKPPFRDSGGLKKSIKYQVKKTVSLVGATWPEGAHGSILTWGRGSGASRGELKPRPFMYPALLKVRNTLPSKWRNRL